MEGKIHRVGQDALAQVWQDGRNQYFECTIEGITGAVDREYRLLVTLKDGRRFVDCAPECVLTLTVRKPIEDTNRWFNSEQNRRLIVADENMLLMEVPEIGKWRIEVSLITKGARLRPFMEGGYDLVEKDFKGMKWRLATEVDFETFGVCPKTYLSDSHYEFDRAKNHSFPTP